MEGIEPVEPGPDLPLPPRELDPALGDPDAGLGAEERVLWSRPFATGALVGPEAPQLRCQRVGEEDVARAAALGDLGADPDTRPGRPVRREHVADVEADDLGEP